MGIALVQLPCAPVPLVPRPVELAGYVRTGQIDRRRCRRIQDPGWRHDRIAIGYRSTRGSFLETIENGVFGLLDIVPQAIRWLVGAELRAEFWQVVRLPGSTAKPFRSSLPGAPFRSSCGKLQLERIVPPHLLIRVILQYSTCWPLL